MAESPQLLAPLAKLPPLKTSSQLHIQNVGLMEAFMAVKLLPLLNPGVGPRSSSNKHLAR